MKIFWFIPTHGDSRYLGTARGARPLDHDYLRQIATAADSLGYEGVLIPTGRSCEDPWVVAASLIPVTRRLKFLVAVRPGLHQPSLAARMAATFDRLSGGRLLINLVTGGDRAELEGDGVFLDHAQRYEHGRVHPHLARDPRARPPGRGPGPHGRTPQRRARALFRRCSGRTAGVLRRPRPRTRWRPSRGRLPDGGEPPAEVAAKGPTCANAPRGTGARCALASGCTSSCARPTAAAWAAAEQLISHVQDETVVQAQAAFARMDSEGQRRMAVLHGGGTKRSRADLEISPNLWAGVGLVRGGAGTALVGDPQTVAARIQEYAQLGIDTFVFSGYPHLEEAYRFAELVFPLLPLDVRQRLGLQPAGEAVANLYVPRAAQS